MQSAQIQALIKDIHKPCQNRGVVPREAKVSRILQVQGRLLTADPEPNSGVRSGVRPQQRLSCFDSCFSKDPPGRPRNELIYELFEVPKAQKMALDAEDHDVMEAFKSANIHAVYYT